MANLEPGSLLEIPCTFEPGAFVGEAYVTIALEDEEISGFIPVSLLKKINEKSGSISAKIVEVFDDSISVRIPGSFFTTTGIAELSKGWATTNIKSAQ